jgi:hypothetical protein
MIQKVEVKINIEDCKQPYIDNLILGLVHAGYDAYFCSAKEEICFTGWKDELITEIKETK